MSADLLRRAAAKIREAAQAATPGPWAVRPDGFMTDVEAPAEGGPVVVVEHGKVADHNHIALWSPDVAELVADVLDETAEAIDFHGVADIDVAFGSELALARRILGEDA